MKPVKVKRGMRLPSLRRFLAFTATLTILNQETGAVEPFVINIEQKAIAKALLEDDRVRTGKGRQIGSTTVHAAVMYAAMLMNPGLPCAVVADSWDNAEGVVEKIAHWAKADMGLHPVTDNVRTFALANGSSVKARTAMQPAGDQSGEAKTGRSKSFGIVLATERSFWRNAKAVWAAATSALLGTARVWDESTGAPGDGAFRASFDVPAGTADGWRRIFIGIEAHEHYRLGPNDETEEGWAEREAHLTDARWAELRDKYGFTRRDSAAWWEWKLVGDFNGDESRMLREYPVKPEHMFSFKEGQHITRWTVANVLVEGEWNYYRAPIRISDADELGVAFDVDSLGEPVVAGIDTAHGVGGKGDASAISLVGHRSGRVLATYRNNAIPIPMFLSLVDGMVARFRPVAIVVESNGVGAASWAHCSLHHANTIEHWSGEGEGEVFERRDRLRFAIEKGEVPIGGHLVLEANSSSVKGRVGPDGRVRPIFVGSDDVLSATSFARKWIEANPPEPVTTEPDPNVYRLTERLKARTAKRVTHF